MVLRATAVLLLCLSASLAMEGVKVPDVLKPKPALPAGNGTNATDGIADLGPSEEQMNSPYHIETKSIHYLLDGIAAKIKLQHDKLLNQHKKNQDRVKNSARSKVAAAQKVLDAASKTDTANDLLLKAARAKLKEAETAAAKANITKVRSAAVVLGATQDLDTVKKEAMQEVNEATKSNEEQVNEALEILGNEMKLVETVRFMLQNLNKQKKVPGTSATAAEIEKEAMAKALDLANDAAVMDGKANGHVKPERQA